jgi:hypothetical protein
MKRYLGSAIAACGLWIVVACNATGEERAYDTTRPVPGTTPTLSVPPDSTTGVARSTGRPGVAGDTVSRSSEISAPPGKAPAPKQP